MDDQAAAREVRPRQAPAPGQTGGVVRCHSAEMLRALSLPQYDRSGRRACRLAPADHNRLGGEDPLFSQRHAGALALTPPNAELVPIADSHTHPHEDRPLLPARHIDDFIARLVGAGRGW
jgi:hypothetical protein